MTVPAGFRASRDIRTLWCRSSKPRAQVMRYRRERWQTPDGITITASLPAGVNGHFGPELRRFVLAQHHQCQVTQARRLVVQLRAVGIDVSATTGDALADCRPGWFLRTEARGMFCVPAWPLRPGSRWTTPARATRPPTAPARRSATTTSLGSARQAPRAG